MLIFYRSLMDSKETRGYIDSMYGIVLIMFHIWNCMEVSSIWIRVLHLARKCFDFLVILCANLYDFICFIGNHEGQ